MTVKAFLLKHIDRLNTIYHVSVLVDDTNNILAGVFELSHVDIYHVEIPRKVSVIRDIKALWKIIQIFRSNKFDVVHSVTPKAGLLAMTAAFLVGVKHRVHIFTGQVWVTRTGMARRFFKLFDKLIAKFASNILVDSNTQKEFLIKEKVISSNNSSVLANGSISGVDIDKYICSESAREEERQRHGIPDNAFVFLFVGRLNRDKGINELAQAFDKICDTYVSSYLVVAGPDEENLLPSIKEQLSETSHHFLYTGPVDNPLPLYCMANVFVLPSHREGFGTVILEAAAAGLPSIGSNIYGLQDAIVDNETGLLVEKNNADDLMAKMKMLLDNQELVVKLGKAARDRVTMHFSQKLVTKAWVDYYRDMLT